jgi:hypothetical protein
LFCIPVVLLCEYGIYRVVWPEQGKVKTLLISIYANSISGVLGIFIGEPLDDIAMDVSWKLGSSNDGWVYGIILFVLLFVLTWLSEGIAVFLLRRKLRVKRVFFGTGIANAASYIAILVMLVLYHHMTV